MIIPANDLAKDVLHNILEEFITRDGTDYGETELNLAVKVDRLMPQVLSGQVLLVYDEGLQTVNLMSKADYQQHMAKL